MNIHSQTERGAPSAITGTTSLGQRLRALRTAAGLTLREMSGRVAIPVSTLSKVERNELTLSYPQLQRVIGGLGLRADDLFAAAPVAGVTGWRSIERGASVTYVPAGDHEYSRLCADVRQKCMTPVLIRLRAGHSRAHARICGDASDEYLYVLSGSVVLDSQLYSSVVLNPGDSVYLDARMQHSYAVRTGCPEATGLLMCSERAAPDSPE